MYVRWLAISLAGISCLKPLVSLRAFFLGRFAFRMHHVHRFSGLTCTYAGAHRNRPVFAAQDLTAQTKDKAFSLKQGTKDTSESTYQAALKKLADARAAASAKLEETRAASETHWSKPSSLWERMMPAQRTTSQKAWDTAQVGTASMSWLCGFQMIVQMCMEALCSVSNHGMSILRCCDVGLQQRHSVDHVYVFNVLPCLLQSNGRSHAK